MSVYTNATMAPLTDGKSYSVNVPLTSNEAVLSTSSSPWYPDPVPLSFQQALVATVLLSAPTPLASNASYVVLQTDMGDGVWVDVAWAIWTGTSGNAVFLFSVMGNPALTLAVQQTRAAGTAPGSTGQNNIALGARFRFVGKATINAGSSSSPSAGFSGVQATIKFKLLGLT